MTYAAAAQLSGIIGDVRHVSNRSHSQRTTGQEPYFTAGSKEIASDRLTGEAGNVTEY